MKSHRPRRGSLAFSPRKRAKSEVPRIRSWPEYSGEPRLQGFAGYKVGMTHCIIIDDRPNSPTEGMEISVPVTVIETPPLKVAGVRVYRKTTYGLQIAYEQWAENLDEELERRKGCKISKYKPESNIKENIESLKNQDDIVEVRLVTYTQPYRVTGVPKKTPEIMENKVGGSDTSSILEYAVEQLGKEVRMGDVFSEGKLVDVVAVTKGKGTQGPVKRWGVITLDAKHARSSKHRRIGNLGPWTPHRVRWTVPQTGQMGYHQRTEYNKRILTIGDNGEEITPQGGFLHYGVVRNEYCLIEGSIPGPIKRLVRIRDPIRPHGEFETKPNLVYVSKASKQGV
jgi:large subunit ribosomal protein L3